MLDRITTNLKGGSIMKVKNRIAPIILSFACIVGGFGQAIAAPSESCAGIYDGTSIKILTSFGPGGGGDQLARVHANILTKHLPGNPASSVENRPGGGHGVGAAYLAQATQPDGLTLFYTNSNVLRTFVSAGDTAGYDPRKFQSIGAINVSNQILVIRPEVLDHLLDVDAEPVVVGDTNGVRAQVPLTLMAADYLGHNYTWAVGYEGGDELVLALMRGEIDVYGSINRGEIANIISEGAGVPYMQAGDERSPDFPDTPTLQEMFDEAGVALTPEDKAAYDNWLAPERAQHLFMAPEGTPENVMTCLKEVYVEIAQDEEFGALVEAVVGDTWKLVSPEDTTDLVNDASTVTDDITERLREIRKEHGLPVR